MPTVNEARNISLRMGFEDAGFVAGMQRAATAAKAAGDAGEQAAAGVREVETEVRRAGPSVETLNKRYDEQSRVAGATAAANRRLAAELQTLRQEVERGNKSQAEATEIERRATLARDAAVEKARVQAAAMAKGFNDTAAATGNTSRQLQQLTPQLNDLFVQIAGGQGLLMPLIQQGPQIVDIFGSVRKTFEAAGAGIASVARSLGPLNIAFAAAGVGAVAFIGVIEAQDAKLRTLSNRLRATRDDFDAAAQSVTAAARAAASSSSLGTSDATAAGLAIKARPEFTGTQQDLTSLIKLSGDLAKVFNEDIPAAAGRVAEALKSPGAVARKLADDDFRALDNSLARNIERLEAQGNKAEATRLVLEAYRKGTADAASNQTALQTALTKLGDAFQRLGEVLLPGTSRVLADMITNFANLLGVLDRLNTAANNSALGRLLGFADAAPAAGAAIEAAAAGAGAGGGAAANAQRINDAMGLVGKINPRIRQQQDNRDQAKALTDALALPGVTKTQADEMRAALGSLGEAYEGLQGPVAEYLKGLRDQVTISRSAEGAAREYAQANVAVEKAHGGAAAAAEARSLIDKRLDNELVNSLITLNRQIVGTDDLAEATSKGALAAREMEARTKAEADALKYAEENTDRYNRTVATLTVRYTDLAEKQAKLRSAATARDAQQSLDLIQKETELLGTSEQARTRELALMRERQKLENDGFVAGDKEYEQRLRLVTQTQDATATLARQKDALSELQNIGTQAFDRIGAALTEAFTQGKGAAVNFGNVAKAVLSELLQSLVKLGVMRPIMNTIFGTNYSTLSDVGGIAGKLFGGGSAAGVGDAASSGAAGAASGGGVDVSSLGTYAGLAQKGYSLFSGSTATSPYALDSLWGANSVAVPANQVGLGSVDALNAALPANPTVSSAGLSTGSIGSTLASEAYTGVGGTSVSYGAALGGAAGIAGGAYGIYSGLQRGGTGGYTSAAGGAVGVAAGAASLGAFGPALAALGPYGLIAAAVIMLIGSMLPGAKPSNKTGSAGFSFDTGEAFSFGQTGSKYSPENRAMAMDLGNRALSVADQIEKLTGGTVRGAAVIDVGNRDGLAAQYHGVNGYDTGSVKFTRDEDGQKNLMTFLVQNIVASMAGSLPEALEHAVAGMAKTGAEQIVTDLAKFMDASTKGKFSDAQNIASRNIDFGNTDAAVAELKWVRDIYDPLQHAAEAANQYQTQLDAITAKWGDLTDHANRLGLATDKLTEAQTKEIDALNKQRQSVIDNFDAGLGNREKVASGTYVADPLAVALEAFDADAKQQVATATATLQQWGVLAEDQSSRILRLETVLASERVKLITDANAAQAKAVQDQIDAVNAAVAAQQQAVDAALGGSASYEASLRAINKKWDDLATTSRQLGLATDALTAARDRELAAVAAQRATIEGNSADSLRTRLATLANPAAGAAMTQATQQRAEMAQLVATLTQAGSTAATIAAQVATLQRVQAGDRAKSAYDTAAANYAAALQQQISATQEQITTQQANTAALANVATNLRQWLQSLSISEQSPLTPTQRMDELRRQLGAAVATAGDTTLSGADRATAGQQAQTLAQQLLTEAGSYFGRSTEAYASEYEAVSSTISKLADSFDAGADVGQSQLKVAQSQLTILQQQLAETQRLGEAQYGSLEQLRQTMADAMAQLIAAKQAAGAAAGVAPVLTKGEAGIGTGVTAVTGGAAYSGGYVANQIDAGLGGDMAAREAAYLARNPDVAAAIAAGQTFGSVGRNNAGEAAYLHFVQFGQAEGRAFAKGGIASPGWAMVGEHGAELVNFSNPGRVYTAPETRAALGANDNSATDELRALRAELAALRNVMAAGTVATVQAVERGNDLQAEGVTDRKLSLAR